MMVPLRYLSKFWRTLEMPLINCEINLILTWSANCAISISNENEETTFPTTDTRKCDLVVTLSTQDNAKLLQKLKSGSKHRINWNKYYSKAEPLNAPKPYLDFLIYPIF